MDDVSLTFNPKMFTDGISQIVDGISEVNRNMEKFGTQATKKLKAVNVSAMSMLKGFALIKGVVGAARGALNKIPEIGRSFSIAGDIISRNLLWPLRKELVPLLQKMLDWVRDNRAMFVKWGNVIANVFRVIKNFISGVWNFIKRIWKSFADSMSGIFGKTQQSISDLANIVLFKISSVISFIMLAIEPVADFIGKIFATMAKAGMAFIKGLSNSMKNFLPVLGEIWDSIKGLADAIGLSSANGNTLVKVFRTLGNVIGSVVMPALRAVATVIDTLAGAINDMSLAWQINQAAMKGDLKTYNRLQKERAKLNTDYFNKQKKRWGEQVDDWKRAGSDIKDTWTEADQATKNVTTNNTVKNTTSTIRSDNRKNNVVNQNVTITNNISGTKNPSAIQSDVAKSIRDALNEEKFRRGGK